MLKLQKKLLKVCHWEVLKRLYEKMAEVSHYLQTFRDSADLDEITSLRGKMMPALADAQVCMEIMKVKLSFMPPEFEPHYDKAIRDFEELFCEKDEESSDFDTMEF